MKKFLTLVLALCLILTALTACGSKSDNEGKTEDGNLKIALLIPGNLGDKSFFDGSKTALDTIKETFDADTSIVEMGTDVTKYYATYQDYCESGYDLILTISTTGDDVLKQIAEEYPEQKFINLDTDSEGFPENVLPIVTKSNEMSALAGAVAAIKAQEVGSDVIGFIGGMDIPGINYFLVGYIEGAQGVNPDIKVNYAYVGSFTDSATAKELALIMYNSGVPIIYQAAGGSGLGVFEAAASKDKLAIGVDSDQALSLEDSSPDQAEHIVTSAMKKVSSYAVTIVQEYVDGTLTFGETRSMGLAEDAVGLAENSYYDALMNDEQKKIVSDLRDKIVSGEVTLSKVQTMSTDQIDEIRKAAAAK